MENEKPSYYAILTADVRYDKDLTDREKLLFAEITTLCNKTGECWASNEYFAELYGVTSRSIRTSISHLVKKGYIERKLIYKNDSKEVEKRIITLGKNISLPCGKILPGGEEKFFPDNNTSINNININNICSEEKKEQLEKKSDDSDFFGLSVEEKFNLIAEYCKEKNYDINIKHFVEYYEETKWRMANGKKIKNWKLAVCSWANKSYNSNSQKNFSSSPISSKAKPVDDHIHYEQVSSGFEIFDEYGIDPIEYQEKINEWRDKHWKETGEYLSFSDIPDEIRTKALKREL